MMRLKARGSLAFRSGRPIANAKVYVLDRNLQPVPVGVAGELYIGGVGLARGYLGRPALTAERFVPTPFGARRAPLYRTGDLARWRADGILELLGRADQQVKLRGFRIEPGEIEAALVRACLRGAGGGAGARGCARRQAAGGLCGCCRGPGPRSCYASCLCGAQPSGLHGAVGDCGSGSLAADGERQVGPPCAACAGFTPQVVRLPRTPQEEILCSLFAEVLGLQQVGIDDNFFALGGDSIMSIQLVSRARNAGLTITPRAVFQHQTVMALAAAAKLLVETASASALPDIAIGALPPTPIMCWLAELGGPIERFNQAMLLRLPPGVQEDQLIAALQAVLDHHDALRLRVVAAERPGEWALEIVGAWSGCGGELSAAGGHWWA